MTDITEHSSPLEYPCDFTIKVMGKKDSTFETTVLKIVRKEFPSVTSNDISKRPSKGDNYIALSIKVHATAKEQLDNIYQALSNSTEVLMAL